MTPYYGCQRAFMRRHRTSCGLEDARRLSPVGHSHFSNALAASHVGQPFQGSKVEERPKRVTRCRGGDQGYSRCLQQDTK